MNCLIVNIYMHALVMLNLYLNVDTDIINAYTYNFNLKLHQKNYLEPDKRSDKILNKTSRFK